jgi:hypothetical protein
MTGGDALGGLLVGGVPLGGGVMLVAPALVDPRPELETPT